MQNAIYILLSVVILFLALYIVWKSRNEKTRLVREYEEKIRDMGETHHEALGNARKESVQMSRNTLRGKVAEQVAPMLPGFDYSPSDARFLGDPIDYIVFSGYSKVRDGIDEEDELEVVILDIKSGKARLSKEQRRIAEAVEAGRVRFEVVRVSGDGVVEKHQWRRRKSRKGKTAEKANKKKPPVDLKMRQVVDVETYTREKLKWLDKEELFLKEKVQVGVSIEKIAQILKRSPESVRAHLGDISNELERPAG